MRERGGEGREREWILFVMEKKKVDIQKEQDICWSVLARKILEDDLFCGLQMGILTGGDSKGIIPEWDCSPKSCSNFTRSSWTFRTEGSQTKLFLKAYTKLERSL